MVIVPQGLRLARLGCLLLTKNSIKLGKKRQRTNGSIFNCVHHQSPERLRPRISKESEKSLKPSLGLEFTVFENFVKFVNFVNYGPPPSPPTLLVSIGSKQ